MHTFLLLVLLHLPAVKPAPLSHKDTRAFLDAMAMRESSNNQYAVNKYGMLGKYQFSPATLKAMGLRVSKKRFLSDAVLQDSIMLVYMRDNMVNLARYKHHIGKVHHGVRITQSGLLAGAHLVGLTGVCAWFNPKRCSHITKDANGTTVAQYMKEFADYQIILPKRK